MSAALAELFYHSQRSDTFLKPCERSGKARKWPGERRNPCAWSGPTLLRPSPPDQRFQEGGCNAVTMGHRKVAGKFGGKCARNMRGRPVPQAPLAAGAASSLTHFAEDTPIMSMPLHHARYFLGSTFPARCLCRLTCRTPGIPDAVPSL